jgi:predicted phosphodiesterase
MIYDNLFNEHNIAPYKAYKIGVYDTSTSKKVGTIELNKDFKPSFDERLYRVGLVSDTHYNDSDDSDTNPDTYSDDGSQYAEDFINALTFYNEKEDVEFICSSGDITTDNMNHVRNFNLMRNKYAPLTPVYSCKGNHDHFATYNSNASIRKANNDEWKEYVSGYNDGKEKVYCEDGDGTSFYFIKESDGGLKDVYIFLNIEYIGARTSAATDASSNYIEDKNITYQYYDPKVLNWFARILNAYRQYRCFVFLHLFFRQKAGDNAGKYFHYYDKYKDKSYNLRGKQFLFLNKLNNVYKNSIWFTGHSHFPWYYQQFDKKINICNYDSTFTEGVSGNALNSIVLGQIKEYSGYNIHLPSLARPLALTERNSYGVDKKRSEGAIMDIYKNYVDIRGIVFKDADSNEYKNKYCPVSTYRIPVGGSNLVNIRDYVYSIENTSDYID